MAPPEVKQFLKGERACYEAEVPEKTAEVAAGFESVRLNLAMHKYANTYVRDFVSGLPYMNKNPKYDAFIAWKLVEILGECAKRLVKLGTNDPDDPDLKLQDVDLRAARDTPGPSIDDNAIRKSFHDDRGDVDSDVAKSLGPADDHAIRESAGVHAADRAVEDAETAKKKKPKSDDGGDGGGGGSGEGVQLDMLESAGSEADPVLCARKAAEALFRSVLNGYAMKGDKRPSMVIRLNPLVEYGVLTRTQIGQALKAVADTAEKFTRSKIM